MDLVIVIIIALVTIFGKAASQQKKKQEQERREASARGREMPQPSDPRFPHNAEPSTIPQEQEAFPWAAFPEEGGEPGEALPTGSPAVMQEPVPAGNAYGLEGKAVPVQRSVIMPMSTLTAQIEATKGRRAALEYGEQAYTEGGMEYSRRAVRVGKAEQKAAPQWNMDLVQSAVTRLGRDPKAVAEGVVMSEILGKPKALRR